MALAPWLQDKVDHYKLHGFCLLSPAEAEVPEELLSQLHEDSMHAATKRAPNRGDSRICINSSSLLETNGYWNWLTYLCSGSNVAAIMQNLFGDAWWADSAIGGDIVLPTTGPSHATLPHSDWGGTPDAVTSISVCCHDVGPADGPLQIWSKSTGARTVVVAPKGTILMRDVACIHAGSIHTGQVARCMPSMRFITSQALQAGYKPTPFVPWNQWQRFSEVLQTRCVFLQVHPKVSEPWKLQSCEDGLDDCSHARVSSLETLASQAASAMSAQSLTSRSTCSVSMITCVSNDGHSLQQQMVLSPSVAEPAATADATGTVADI